MVVLTEMLDANSGGHLDLVIWSLFDSIVLFARSRIVRTKAYRSLGFFLTVGFLLEVLDSAPMRLALPVTDEVGLCVEPLRAFDAIVLAEGGQILSRLGLFVLTEMLGRQEVCLDLVEIPGLPSRFGNRPMSSDTHCEFLQYGIGEGRYVIFWTQRQLSYDGWRAGSSPVKRVRLTINQLRKNLVDQQGPDGGEIS